MSKTVNATNYAVLAYGVSLRWQSNDFATPTASTSRGSTATATTGSAFRPMSKNKSGLTSGTKAGIGVGISIAAVLVIALIGWLFFLRRKPREGVTAEDAVMPDEPSFGPGAKTIYDSRPAELAGGRDKMFRYEAPGSPPGYSQGHKTDGARDSHI